eukprot:m.355620 g.355620  ORF g.355620 m.355620 type:complete len:337 (-) comp17294_c0_seq1:1721-2731(-)
MAEQRDRTYTFTQLVLANKSQQELLVMTACVTLDHCCKVLWVSRSRKLRRHGREPFLDEIHIGLSVFHNQVDECKVGRAPAFHALKKSSADVFGWVAGEFSNGGASCEKVAAQLRFQHGKEVLVRDAFVRSYHSLDVGVAALSKHFDELGLIGAPLLFTCVKQSLCISLDLLGIHWSAERWALACKDGDQQLAEITAGVIDDVSLEIAVWVACLVRFNHFKNLIGLLGAENINEKTLVSTPALDTTVQEVCATLNIGHDKCKKASTEVARSVLGDEVFQRALVGGFKGTCDTRTLVEGTTSQDLDELLVVGTKTLHCLVKCFGITTCTEVHVWLNG